LTSATVGDVGESELLRLIAERTGTPPAGEVWAGDDAAVLAMSSHSLLATDCIVENLDFSFSYCSGADIGWKALAINASDIAAMGGRPLHAVASLGMPPSLPLAVFEDVLEGLLQGTEHLRMSLVGGDLSGAREVFLSVTVTGSAELPILRSGAKPGDEICVTGSLGGSNGGLFALRNGVDKGLPGVEALARRHLRPEARVAAGMALAAGGVTALIDVSDGFALDLTRLLRASGQGCEVSSDALPIEPGLEILAREAGGPEPVEAALTGGEDYELICTIEPSLVASVAEAVEQTGTSLTVVGRVTEGEMNLDGRPLREREHLGWDHLRNL
jgi:thiamine-monophosphate kinase